MERRWTPNQLLIANVATLVVVLVILAVQLPAVLAAAFGAGLGTDEPTEVVTRLIEFHDEWMETDQRRFTGRSFFFKPPPKAVPRPPREVVDIPPAPPPEPVELPPSLVYTGPSVIGILGDEVWFRAPRAGSLGLRIRVGQEPQEGITVLATNPPWSVTLGYQRGEYDIDVWKNDFPGIERSAPPSRPIPGLIEPAPETPTETPSESADDAETAAVLDAQPGGTGEKDQPGSPTADAEATTTEPEGDPGHPDPKPAEPTGPAKKESTTDDGATGTVPEGDADRPEPEPAKMAEEESTADDEDGSPSDPQEQ